MKQCWQCLTILSPPTSITLSSFHLHFLLYSCRYYQLLLVLFNVYATASFTGELHSWTACSFHYQGLCIHKDNLVVVYSSSLCSALLLCPCVCLTSISLYAMSINQIFLTDVCQMEAKSCCMTLFGIAWLMANFYSNK